MYRLRLLYCFGHSAVVLFDIYSRAWIDTMRSFLVLDALVFGRLLTSSQCAVCTDARFAVISSALFVGRVWCFLLRDCVYAVLPLLFSWGELCSVSAWLRDGHALQSLWLLRFCIIVVVLVLGTLYPLPCRSVAGIFQCRSPGQCISLTGIRLCLGRLCSCWWAASRSLWRPCASFCLPLVIDLLHLACLLRSAFAIDSGIPILASAVLRALRHSSCSASLHARVYCSTSCLPHQTGSVPTVWYFVRSSRFVPGYLLYLVLGALLRSVAPLCRSWGSIVSSFYSVPFTGEAC